MKIPFDPDTYRPQRYAKENEEPEFKGELGVGETKADKLYKL